MSTLKGFAFDLDGVITDTAYYHALAWQALCDKIGAQWTEKIANETKGVSRKASLLIILKENNMQDKYTEAEIDALLVEKNELYKQMIEKLTPSDILPGISELLSDMQAKGYKIALASASLNAPKILSKLGLADAFEDIVDPTSLKQGKPSPDIYLKAAELLQLDPNEMMGIEDAKSGIQAVNSSGMMSVGIGDGNILQEADLCVGTTAQLTLPLLEKTFAER